MTREGEEIKANKAKKKKSREEAAVIIQIN